MTPGSGLPRGQRSARSCRSRLKALNLYEPADHPGSTTSRWRAAGAAGASVPDRRARGQRGALGWASNGHQPVGDLVRSVPHGNAGPPGRLSAFGNRVSFVGVATKDSPQAAAAFLEGVGVAYPQLLDVDGQLLASLGIPGLPVTVVLDAQGRVKSTHVGPLSPDRLGDLVGTAMRTADPAPGPTVHRAPREVSAHLAPVGKRQRWHRQRGAVLATSTASSAPRTAKPQEGTP